MIVVVRGGKVFGRQGEPLDLSAITGVKPDPANQYRVNATVTFECREPLQFSGSQPVIEDGHYLGAVLPVTGRTKRMHFRHQETQI